MGNIISSDRDPTTPDLAMSNGLTSVFLSALLLSGAEIAQSDWEMSALVWLAEHDQDIVGRGVVGFDLSELAWTPEGFAEQRAFMLATIDGALAHRGWDRLDYEPSEERLLPALAGFREMIVHYPIEDHPAGPWEAPWSTAGLRGDRARCPTHGVYLHDLVEDDVRCCIVCND